MSEASTLKKGFPVPLGRPTVAVSDLHVRYSVPSVEHAAESRKTRTGRMAARLVGYVPRVQVRALVGVSFVARAGESVGVIGLNGSGKSTLLRVIAGLETPARGTVLAESPPVLLGVNAALLPELPGIDNVRLGLLAMGKTPAETAELLPAVVELAGIGKAIYLPMKTYSSGMASRLRFAIAAAANPNILLIDEALSTGDAAFKERSEDKMAKLRQNAGTVFLVSHAAQTVEELCTRAIWLDQGRVIVDGPAYETAQRYRLWSWSVAKGDRDKAKRIFDEALHQQSRTEAVDLIEPIASREMPRHGR